MFDADNYKGNPMTKLKPCPFCGETENIRFEHDTYLHVVRCLTCKAAGPFGNGKTTQEKSIDAALAWNASAKDEPEPKITPCPTCGATKDVFWYTTWACGVPQETFAVCETCRSRGEK